MEVNPTKLARLINIHKSIASKSFPNTKDLAKENNVSISTTSLDINTLSSEPYCAPIGYNSTKKGYFYTKDYSSIKLSKIKPEQIHVLSAAKTILSVYKETPLYNDVIQLIETLSNYSFIDDQHILKRIALPPFPKMKSIIEQDLWNKIFAGIKDNRKISINYKGRWSKGVEETTHIVSPYQILLVDGVSFLWGKSEQKNDTRLFSIHRIKRANLLMQKFDLPEDFEFEKQCGGGKFGTFVGEDQETFEIDFYDDTRLYIRERIWADDQEIIERDCDNTTTIIFSSSQYNHVLEWVLAQGAKAKPISPECFVADWKDHIRRMAKSANIL